MKNLALYRLNPCTLRRVLSKYDFPEDTEGACRWLDQEQASNSHTYQNVRLEIVKTGPRMLFVGMVNLHHGAYVLEYHQKI
jgi:hypothetical protein